jgi:pterin-4a-carbinolamine dehydratase
MKEWRAHFFNGNSSKVEKFSRKFHCRNFQSALEAVNTIGLLAENSGYVLDLHVTSYCDVEIVLYTKSTDGEVTLDDMELVKAMDVEITTNYVV